MSRISGLRRQALRKIAEDALRANDGQPYSLGEPDHEGNVFDVICWIDGHPFHVVGARSEAGDDDCRHIAAFDPATALALLDALDEAEAQARGKS